MGVGLVRNKFNSRWLKYLSVVQDGEGVCFVKDIFSGHGINTHYCTIKAQIMAIGRSSLSAANRDGSLWVYSEQPPSYLSGGRAGGRVRALVKYCLCFV